MQTHLIPEGYIPRVVDARIDKLLKAFGGLEVTGPKWCGKTWTASAHASSIDSLMDPATLDAASIDPSLVLSGPEPHLVDEWQEVPELWDAVRAHIDANANRKGQIILTGSSIPKDRERIRHSGAGRIARIRMRPMTLFESRLVPGGVSFARLFEGEFPQGVRAPAGIVDIARWCCRGGWPSILGMDDEFALEIPMEYLRSVTEVNVPALGKDASVAFGLMKALAINTGRAATLKTLAADMQEDGDAGHASTTVRTYLDVLEDLYLLEDLGGWEPPLRSKARVRVKPKHYYVDPSLPAALMGASPQTLLRDTQALGGLFETLVVRDIRTYLSVMPGAANKLAYYRDEKGLEVDVIVELTDGRWGALEVKLFDSKADEATAGRLIDFKKKICSNPRAQVKEPSFLAIVVGKGDIAYRRKDGVLIIPVAAMEP